MSWWMQPVAWSMSPLTLGFVVSVVVITIFAAFKEFQVWWRCRALKALIAKHLGVRAGRDGELFGDKVRLDAFRDDLERAGFRHFAAQVWEFGEATHVRVFDEHGSTRFHNAFPASEFFQVDRFREDISEESGLLGLIPPSLLDATPGVLTSLGILGTFIGIVMGLSEAQLGGTEQAPLDIEMLLAGLSISFKSSVAGLVGSIFVTLLSRLVDATADTVMSDLIIALDRAIERRTPQQVLEEILIEQEQSRGALQTLKTDLSEAIERALNSAVQEHLAPTFVRLEAHTAEMKEATIRLADGAAEKQVEGVSALAAQLQMRMEDAIGTSMVAAGEQLAAFAQTQQTITKQWADGAALLATSAQRLERTTRGQTELADTMTEVFEGATEAGQRFDSAATGLAETAPALRDTARKAAQLLEAANQSIAGLAERQASLTEQTKSQTSQLFSSLESQTRSMQEGLGSVTGDLETTLTRLTEALDASASQLGESSTAIMTSSREAARTSSAATKLMAEQQSLQEEVQDSLTEAVKVVATVAAAAEKLSTMQRRMSDADQQFDRRLDKLSRVSSAQEGAAEGTLKAAKQMQTSLESRLMDWNKVSREFEGINRTLVSGMSTFADQFPERIRQNLEEFDKELAEAVNKLNRSYSGLKEQVLEFNEAFAEAVDRLPPRGR